MEDEKKKEKKEMPKHPDPVVNTGNTIFSHL
jgi:hypothetical protein